MGSMSVNCTRCNEDIDWPRSLRHTLCDWCTRVKQGKETDKILVAEKMASGEPLSRDDELLFYLNPDGIHVIDGNGKVKKISDKPVAPKRKRRKKKS